MKTRQTVLTHPRIGSICPYSRESEHECYCGRHADRLPDERAAGIRQALARTVVVNEGAVDVRLDMQALRAVRKWRSSLKNGNK